VQERAGTLAEEPYRRGHRIKILSHAPLKRELGRKGLDRLVRAFSVIYGIEAYVVLRDIWGAGDKEIESIARWIADALVDALRDASADKRRRKARDGRYLVTRVINSSHAGNAPASTVRATGRAKGKVRFTRA
jgi:hypothetical protein